MRQPSGRERLGRLWKRICPSGRVRAVLGAGCAATLLGNLVLPLTAAAAAPPTATPTGMSGMSLMNFVTTAGSREQALNQTITLDLSQMTARLAALQSVASSVYGATYAPPVSTPPVSTPPVSTPPVTTPPVTTPPVTTPPVTTPPVTTPPVTTPPVTTPAVTSNATLNPANGSVSNAVYNGAWNPNAPPPLPDLPAAPPTFVPYLKTLIQQLDKASAVLPVLNPASFAASNANIEAAIGKLTPQEINLMYWAMQQAPNWQSLPGTLASATAELSRTPGLAASVHAMMASMSQSVGTSGPSGLGGASSPAIAGTTTTSLSPQTQSTTTTTTTISSVFTPSQAPAAAADDGLACPPNIPFPGMPLLINSLDLAKLALRFVKELLPHEITFGAIVVGEGVVGTIPDPGFDIFEGLEDAADLLQIAATTYDDTVVECGTEAHHALLVTLYNNLANTQATVILQTTVLLQEVGALTRIVNSRTAVIITDVGNLGKNLGQDVSVILNGQLALTNVMNQQEEQNIHNQAVSAKATDLQLKLAIERDLAAALNDNVIQFELPSQAGGYLTGPSISVQSVVTGLLTSMQQVGEGIAPDVTRLLSLADAALVSKDYRAAYALFKVAYHELADYGPPMPSGFPAQGRTGP